MNKSVEQKNELKSPSVILMDLGNVILYSKEELPGKMNPRHKELLNTKGFDYPFFDYFGVREKLLDFLASQKSKRKIWMLTEGVIQNHPPLKEKLEQAFDLNNILSTGPLGLDKKKPEAYEYVVDQLNVSPQEILFVDDSANNVNAAAKVGLQTIQCTTEDQTIADMKQMLS